MSKDIAEHQAGPEVRQIENLKENDVQTKRQIYKKDKITKIKKDKKDKKFHPEHQAGPEVSQIARLPDCKFGMERNSFDLLFYFTSRVNFDTLDVFQ